MKPIPTETGTDVGNVGKWVGAAVAGAVLMYLLDPERGPARRARAASALREAGERTGATVDSALHGAGERLADLKDSAAGALARSGSRLHAEAAPLLARAHEGAVSARERFAAEASHARAQLAQRAGQAREHLEERQDLHKHEQARKQERERELDREHQRQRHLAQAARNRYVHDDRYRNDDRHLHDDRDGAGHGLAGWLQHLGDRIGDTLGASRGPDSALLGGGMLGVLGLMRRSPAGLLVGLAGLALLMRSTGTRRYSVGSLALPSTRHLGAQPQPQLQQKLQPDLAPALPHPPSDVPSSAPSGNPTLH